VTFVVKKENAMRFVVKSLFLNQIKIYEINLFNVFLTTEFTEFYTEDHRLPKPF